jgi:hypothetical protein
MCLLAFVIISVFMGADAYCIYFERKISAFIQAPLGPMRVGPWGLLQPIADLGKLIQKENLIPAGSSRFLYLAAPAISLFTASHFDLHRFAIFCEATRREEETAVSQSLDAGASGPIKLSVGQTIEEVTAIQGEPQKIVELGLKKIYIYKDIKITFMDGKVTDVQ